MTSREYLGQAYRLEQRIKLDKEEIEALHYIFPILNLCRDVADDIIQRQIA